MLTLASSKPSISVSKVDRSLSPTVMLLLELNNNNHIEEEKKKLQVLLIVFGSHPNTFH